LSEHCAHQRILQTTMSASRRYLNYLVYMYLLVQCMLNKNCTHQKVLVDDIII